MIFNRNKITKTELLKERDALEKEVYDLKKQKANLKHQIEMEHLERKQLFERDVNKFENEKKTWKDNQENFIRAVKTENEILKEELEYIKKFKTLRVEAKMISEKDLIFDTLEKVKELTYKD